MIRMFPCGSEMSIEASIACTSDATGELHWNTAALPLSLIIPTFDLPTLSVPIANTASYTSIVGAPISTQIAPSATMEGSADKVFSETSRLWRFCLIFLLIDHIFLCSLWELAFWYELCGCLKYSEYAWFVRRISNDIAADTDINKNNTTQWAYCWL